MSSKLELVVKNSFLQLEVQSPSMRRCNSTPASLDMAELNDHYALTGNLFPRTPEPYVLGDKNKVQKSDDDVEAAVRGFKTNKKQLRKKCGADPGTVTKMDFGSGSSGFFVAGKAYETGQSLETSTDEGSNDDSLKYDASSPLSAWGETPESEGRTTVMLRNVPADYSRAMLMELLDVEGFTGTYDFLYLPIQFASNKGFGYAFINFVDSAVTVSFWAHFQGFSRWGVDTDRVAEVTWSWKHQGLTQHIERYRNSPVMHDSMPDVCKPIVLCNGVRVTFPRPTKRIQQPRMRTQKSRKAGGMSDDLEAM
eukprot:TRINITY_DN10938_c0_g1_i1.p1 TRINITY_DN10938_c0_g1~~TRINITY_DN10938_c0_g1_i1.p1  ORF type:complete len:309 (-),score=63.15 TRINITY_DN10938_c0_g1_i1:238-1164(-)